MRPIVTDRVAWFVCRPITLVSPAKMAEQTKMHAVGVDLWCAQRSMCYIGVEIPHGKEQF